MSGKRLLDAIQFLSVSKSVASKHLAVRQRQLDVYTRTSSLTKGIKNQADGLILTAKAAAALSKRFNDTPPPQSTKASARPSEPSHPTQKSPKETEVPSSAPGNNESTASNQLNVSSQQEKFYRPWREPAAEPAGTPQVKVPHATSDTQVGLDRDINADTYKPPAQTSSGDVGPHRAEQVNVSPQQEEAYRPFRHATADGAPTPDVQIPQATSSTQAGMDKNLNPDTYSSPVDSETASGGRSAEQELPDEMMKDIFRSPKVASSLSRKAAAEIRFGRSGVKKDTRATERPPIEEAERTVEDIAPPETKVQCTLNYSTSY